MDSGSDPTLQGRLEDDWQVASAKPDVAIEAASGHLIHLRFDRSRIEFRVDDLLTDTNGEPALDLSVPFDQCRETILADWVDANQHMNVAYYMIVFDRATEVFLKQLGAGRAYTESGAGTVFALEANIRYEKELRLGDDVRITTRLVGRSAKLLHLLHAMYHIGTGDRAATMELLLLHIDPKVRRGSAWPTNLAARLEKIHGAHRALASPQDVNLKIVIRA